MAGTSQLDMMKNFVALHRDNIIESTGSDVVDYTGDLYNVDGSTDDPKLDGKSWKALLIANGIDKPCYVTNVPPTSGTSHPNKWLGGHMTQNASGKVDTGDDCYLMPLCSWHNSTARNGKAFKHTETEMLKLEGFMEGDTVTTFLMRKRGAGRFRVAYLAGGDWDYTVLRPGTEKVLGKALLPEKLGQDNVPFVLFEKKGDSFQIKDFSGLGV